MTPQPATRNHAIDVLRGVAVLLVLLHHFNIAYSLKDTSLSALIGWDTVRAIARNGNYGVTLFFVISGFLITTHALQRWGGLDRVRLRSFYVQRIGRIVPCLLLLLLIVNLLAGAGIAIFQNKGFGGEAPLPMWTVNLAALTFWMNWLVVHHGWVNYALAVLWSLSVEETFYIVFPLLCLLLRGEKRMLVFWAAIIAIGPLYRFAHQGESGAYLYASFASFDGIAIGCVAAVLAARARMPWLAHGLVKTVVIVLMLGLYLAWPISQSNVLGISAMALGTALLLIGSSSSHAPSVRTPHVMGRTMAACGRLSYELYLFHLIVLGLLRTAWPPVGHLGDARMVMMVVYFALSLLVAWGIARVWSEPLNRWLRGRLQS